MRHPTECRDNWPWLHVGFTYECRGIWVCKSTDCSHRQHKGMYNSKDGKTNFGFDKRFNDILVNSAVTGYYCKALM